MMTRANACALAFVLAGMVAGMGQVRAAEEKEAEPKEVTYNITGMT